MDNIDENIPIYENKAILYYLFEYAIDNDTPLSGENKKIMLDSLINMIDILKRDNDLMKKYNVSLYTMYKYLTDNIYIYDFTPDEHLFIFKQKVIEIKKTLDIKKNLVIYTGWKTHAVTIMIKKENNEYILNIINAGDGVNLHGANEIKCNGILSYNISKEELDIFFENQIDYNLFNSGSYPMFNDKLKFYFYLINFNKILLNDDFAEKNYFELKEPTKIIKTPLQKTGSCTFTSLFFLIYKVFDDLYYSKDMITKFFNDTKKLLATTFYSELEKKINKTAYDINLLIDINKIYKLKKKINYTDIFSNISYDIQNISYSNYSQIVDYFSELNKVLSGYSFNENILRNIPFMINKFNLDIIDLIYDLKKKIMEKYDYLKTIDDRNSEKRVISIYITNTIFFAQYYLQMFSNDILIYCIYIHCCYIQGITDNLGNNPTLIHDCKFIDFNEYIYFNDNFINNNIINDYFNSKFFITNNVFFSQFKIEKIDIIDVILNDLLPPEYTNIYLPLIPNIKNTYLLSESLFNLKEYNRTLLEEYYDKIILKLENKIYDKETSFKQKFFIKALLLYIKIVIKNDNSSKYNFTDDELTNIYYTLNDRQNMLNNAFIFLYSFVLKYLKKDMKLSSKSFDIIIDEPYKNNFNLTPTVREDFKSYKKISVILKNKSEKDTHIIYNFRFNNQDYVIIEYNNKPVIKYDKKYNDYFIIKSDLQYFIYKKIESIEDLNLVNKKYIIESDNQFKKINPSNNILYTRLLLCSYYNDILIKDNDIHLLNYNLIIHQNNITTINDDIRSLKYNQKIHQNNKIIINNIEYRIYENEYDENNYGIINMFIIRQNQQSKKKYLLLTGIEDVFIDDNRNFIIKNDYYIKKSEFTLETNYKLYKNYIEKSNIIIIDTDDDNNLIFNDNNTFHRYIYYCFLYNNCNNLINKYFVRMINLLYFRNEFSDDLNNNKKKYSNIFNFNNTYYRLLNYLYYDNSNNINWLLDYHYNFNKLIKLTKYEITAIKKYVIRLNTKINLLGIYTTFLEKLNGSEYDYIIKKFSPTLYDITKGISIKNPVYVIVNPTNNYENATINYKNKLSKLLKIDEEKYTYQQNIANELFDYLTIDNKKLNDFKVYQIVMGGGKTSVITPLLILKLLKHNKKNIILCIPDNLIEQSFNVLNMYLNNIYNINIFKLSDNYSNRLYTNKKILNEYNQKYIIITTDYNFKNHMYKYYTEYGYRNDQINLLKDNYIIYDEFDFMYNPLTSEINYPKHKYTLSNTDIIFKYCKSIYQIYEDLFYKNKYRNISIDNYNNIIDNYIDNTLNGIFNKIGNNNKLYEYIKRNVLEFIFTKKHNYEYGIPIKYPEDLLDNYKFKIIPYESINKPIYGSEFNDIILVLIATYIVYKKLKFFRQIDIYKYVNYLVNKINIEVDSNNKDKYKKYVKKFLINYTSSKDFYDNLLNSESIGFEYIKNYLISNYKNLEDNDLNDMIDDYFKNVIIELNKFYVKDTDNINFLDLLLLENEKNSVGFTGTPNIFLPTNKIYSSFNFSDEIIKYEKYNVYDKNIDPQITTDQKIYENIKNSVSNIYYFNDTSDIKNYSLNILNCLITNEYKCLIDTGGIFTYDTTELILEKLKYIIENKSDIKHIVYFDDNKNAYNKENNKIENINNIQSDITKDNNILYYFDNSHITGIDVKQYMYNKIKGIATIDIHTRYRDLAQGIYRMRDIGKGQTCDFFITQFLFNKIIKLTEKCTEIINICKNNEEIYKKNQLKNYYKQLAKYFSKKYNNYSFINYYDFTDDAQIKDLEINNLDNNFFNSLIRITNPFNITVNEIKKLYNEIDTTYIQHMIQRQTEQNVANVLNQEQVRQKQQQVDLFKSSYYFNQINCETLDINYYNQGITVINDRLYIFNEFDANPDFKKNKIFYIILLYYNYTLNYSYFLMIPSLLAMYIINSVNKDKLNNIYLFTNKFKQILYDDKIISPEIYNKKRIVYDNLMKEIIGILI